MFGHWALDIEKDNQTDKYVNVLVLPMNVNLRGLNMYDVRSLFGGDGEPLVSGTGGPSKFQRRKSLNDVFVARISSPSRV